MARNMARNMVRLGSSINWILESPLIFWKIQDEAPSVQLPIRSSAREKGATPNPSGLKPHVSPRLGAYLGGWKMVSAFENLLEVSSVFPGVRNPKPGKFP